MTKFLPLFILPMCFLAFACASNGQRQESVSAPKWITDKGRLELFPPSYYVSQFGNGSLPQESKERASAAISNYIKTSVVSSTSANYFYSESINNFSKDKDLRQDIQTTSAADLYHIEFTNPYYDADMAQYVCVAYTNRDQAFEFIRPKLENVKKLFPKEYYAALEEKSLLDKIIRIKRAQKLLPDFYKAYDFARAMRPEKAKVYEELDFMAAESLIKIKESSSAVLIKIQEEDGSDLMEKSGAIADLSNQFKKLGFVVVNSSKNNCLALVKAKAAIAESNGIFETYPELYIRIKEQGMEKISYAKQLPKIAASSMNTLMARIKLALTREIKASFEEECF